MHSQRAPFAVCQHLKISASLRRFYDSECVLLSGHRKISRIVASDLQKHASVWAAFVSLPSGMQETRTKAEARRDVLAIAHRMAHGLQPFFMWAVHFDVSQYSHVITGTELAKVCSQKACERYIRAGKLIQVCHITFVGEKLDTTVIE
jgi:hypothetical protein